MDEEQIVRRGYLAKAVLENVIFQEAFETFEKKCHKAWADSPADEPDLRDNAYLMLKAGQAFKDEIEGIVREAMNTEAIIRHREETENE